MPLRVSVEDLLRGATRYAVISSAGFTFLLPVKIEVGMRPGDIVDRKAHGDTILTVVLEQKPGLYRLMARISIKRLAAAVVKTDVLEVDGHPGHHFLFWGRMMWSCCRARAKNGETGFGCARRVGVYMPKVAWSAATWS